MKKNRLPKAFGTAFRIHLDQAVVIHDLKNSEHSNYCRSAHQYKREELSGVRGEMVKILEIYRI